MKTLRSILRSKLPLHQMDRVSLIPFLLGGRARRIFPRGWGASDEELELLMSSEVAPVPHALDIAWKGKEGTFSVPASECLPVPVRKARIRFLPPPEGSKKLCILLAGWGDDTFVFRMPMVRLLLKQGIGTVLLENPFHGSRRLKRANEPRVATVAEFGAMGRAAIAEAAALVAHFRTEGYTAGISGFSMGGHFAGFVSATSPDAIPTALLAAPCSPAAAFCEGILNKGINWSSLSDRPDPAHHLRAVLERISLLNIDPPRGAERAIIVGARDDQIVQPDAVEAIHRHWSGSTIRWLPGGHFSIWLFERAALTQAIADSFAR